jgi:hypothetical protein
MLDTEATSSRHGTNMNSTQLYKPVKLAVTEHQINFRDVKALTRTREYMDAWWRRPMRSSYNGIPQTSLMVPIQI